MPFPQLWEQVDPLRHDEVAAWLDALADHQERGEVQLYEQGAQALARELGVPDLGLRVLSVEEAYSPPAIDREIAPPAPPDLAAALRGANDRPESRPPGMSSAARRLAGYALAGAAGAALAIILGRRRS